MSEWMNSSLGWLEEVEGEEGVGGVVDYTSPTTPHITSPVVESIQTVSLAIIVVMGILCNTLSLCVFLTPVLRSRSAGWYLAALALSDNCVLVGEAFLWLKEHTIVQDYIVSTAFCRFIYYLRYTGRLWSALLTTVITVERYLFIAHPLTSARFLTRSAARLTILTTFLTSLSLSCYPLYTLQRDEDRPVNCKITPSLKSHFIVWDFVISRVVADAVTGVTVVVFTVLILHTLVTVRRRRRRMLPDVITEDRGHVTTRDIYLTLTLTLIAVSFLLLKLPYTITYYVRYLKKNVLSEEDTVVLDSVIDVTYIFAVLSYAINLFLYSLGGTIFRENLRTRFTRIRQFSLGVISSTFLRTTSSKDVHRASIELV